jgi:hypothetical protein
MKEFAASLIPVVRDEIWEPGIINTGSEVPEGVIINIMDRSDSPLRKVIHGLKTVTFNVCATYRELRNARRSCKGCKLFNSCPIDARIKMSNWAPKQK